AAVVAAASVSVLAVAATARTAVVLARTGRLSRGCVVLALGVVVPRPVVVVRRFGLVVCGLGSLARLGGRGGFRCLGGLGRVARFRRRLVGQDRGVDAGQPGQRETRVSGSAHSSDEQRPRCRANDEYDWSFHGPSNALARLSRKPISVIVRSRIRRRRAPIRGLVVVGRLRRFVLGRAGGFGTFGGRGGWPVHGGRRGGCRRLGLG